MPQLHCSWCISSGGVESNHTKAAKGHGRGPIGQHDLDVNAEPFSSVVFTWSPQDFQRSQGPRLNSATSNFWPNSRWPLHFVQDTRTVLVSSVMKPDTPLLKPACCSMACWGFSCFFSVDCAPKRHAVSQSFFHHLSTPMNNGTSWLKTQSALKPIYLSYFIIDFVLFHPILYHSHSIAEHFPQVCLHANVVAKCFGKASNVNNLRVSMAIKAKG